MARPYLNESNNIALKEIEQWIFSSYSIIGGVALIIEMLDIMYKNALFRQNYNFETVLESSIILLRFMISK